MATPRHQRVKFLSRFFIGDSNVDADPDPFLIPETPSRRRLVDCDCASTACVEAVRWNFRLVLLLVGVVVVVVDADAEVDVEVDAGRLGMTTSIRGLRIGGSSYVRAGVPIGGTGSSSCVCVNSKTATGGYDANKG